MNNYKKLLKEFEEEITSVKKGSFMNDEAAKANNGPALSELEGKKDINYFGIEDSFKQPTDAGKLPKIKNEEKPDNNADKPVDTKKSYEELSKNLTLEDILEKEIDECDDNSMGNNSFMSVKEHDMASGEIAITQALLSKLLLGVIKNGVSEDKVDIIAKAIAGCCDEDRTLDVADIPAILAKMKELAGAGDESVEQPVTAAAPVTESIMGISKIGHTVRNLESYGKDEPTDANTDDDDIDALIRLVKKKSGMKHW